MKEIEKSVSKLRDKNHERLESVDEGGYEKFIHIPHEKTLTSSAMSENSKNHGNRRSAELKIREILPLTVLKKIREFRQPSQEKKRKNHQ